ncbi:phage shock protein A [Scytonema hofmannii PCC 7110]|uniref:Phage shock protein A n=1 Tax=Scytonema hofmannii PCC 7110 TaxID=128403 RepID=A0A139XGS2_9CYAN|nr:PspA/IM30 family protein [Scytonema hofmannii]KYC43895.1 phage shock protein A [Scytonema hofmannii PCC 7110]
MELMNRILRVIRANLNSLVADAEDPEKILEQTVMELQGNLVQLRQAVAQTIAIQKRTERQIASAQSTAEEWYRRAQLALQQENESLAREALTKRQFYQETATALLAQMEQQNAVATKLKQDMRTLQMKMTEAKNKKDLYIARARSAEASYKLQEMLSATSNAKSMKAFERMEEKVLQLEAQAETISITEADPLNSAFAALEESDKVDAELEAMKNKLSHDSGKLPQQLPGNLDK